jgi:hypothetical protein
MAKAFDPIAEGATLVEESAFDPLAEGATLVEENKVPRRTLKDFIGYEPGKTEEKFRKTQEEAVRELPYVAQGAIKEPFKMANVLLPKSAQIPTDYDLAGKISPGLSKEDIKGAESFGGMMGMGAPRAGIMGSLKAAQGIPHIGKVLEQAMKASPILNKLFDVGGRGAEFGLYEAAEHPENQLTRGALGFGLGAGLSGLGHGIQGVANNFAVQSIMKKIGNVFKKPPIKDEFLEGINPFDNRTWERISANEELGIPATIGELTGSPVAGKREGKLSTTAAGGQKMYEDAVASFDKQKDQINKLLTEVSANGDIAAPEIRKAANTYIERMEEARANIVKPIYEESYKKKVAPNKIINLENKDPVIKNAIEHVMSSPTYHTDLEGYSKNSIKVLDLAQRRINDQIKSAGFDTNEARLLSKSRNRLLESMDKYSRNHELARKTYSALSKPIDELKESQLGRIANVSDVQLKNIPKMIFDPQQADIKVLQDVKERIMAVNPEAWDQIVRNEIERLVGKGEGGQKFYKNVLQNKNVFNQLTESLSHKPNVVKKLNNMKKGWDQLIGMETARSAYGKAAQNTDSFRVTTEHIISEFKDAIGDKRGLEKIKYIRSKQFKKDLLEAMGAEPKSNKRIDKLSDILSKTFYGFSAAEQEGNSK